MFCNQRTDRIGGGFWLFDLRRDWFWIFGACGGRNSFDSKQDYSIHAWDLLIYRMQRISWRYQFDHFLALYICQVLRTYCRPIAVRFRGRSDTFLSDPKFTHDISSSTSSPRTISNFPPYSDCSPKITTITVLCSPLSKTDSWTITVPATAEMSPSILRTILGQKFLKNFLHQNSKW